MAWETYKINGTEVTAPDEEAWNPNVTGIALSGEQKRGGYYILEWLKNGVSPCHVDWFTYDNTTLSSLTTRPPDDLDDFTTYNNAICQQVTMRHMRGSGTQVTARFLVYVG